MHNALTFLRNRKRLWLPPLLTAIATLLLVMLLTRGQTVVPFIYNLF